jgi:hypothetical protein
MLTTQPSIMVRCGRLAGVASTCAPRKTFSMVGLESITIVSVPTILQTLFTVLEFRRIIFRHDADFMNLLCISLHYGN